eukprot:766127-Hanusia_phi.AAC.2
MEAEEGARKEGRVTREKEEEGRERRGKEGERGRSRWRGGKGGGRSQFPWSARGLDLSLSCAFAWQIVMGSGQPMNREGAEG